MKALVLIAAMVAASSAFADFNTDAIEKAVTCKGNQTTVKINKARSRILVIDDIDPGHPQPYLVAQRKSDGDTAVWYISRQGAVTLSFDDRGDNLTYKDGTVVSLKCP